MSVIRALAKSCVVLVLGRDAKPRTILRGLASGYRIWVSPTEHLGYLLGTAEVHLQKAIREYVKTGDTVYDIGANLGYVSLSLAKQVGPNGQVIAFEPVPQNIELLRQNIQLNDIRNIRLLEVAASDKQGEAMIRFAENLATASMVWHRNDPTATELAIKTVVVDDLVGAGDLAHPTFVKIDVEGAEGAVLLGMRRTLANSNPVLFIECSDTGRETAWNLLQDLGYRCQSAITRSWINAFADYCHSDFLWLPQRLSHVSAEK
jgi:FkbM family methyltransferase